MTDHDDLASAHLDGTTTPAEAARVAADPDLLARVEALRTVRAAVASALPVDPERREQAIAAALAAYDADVAADTDPAGGASVRALAPVTARRSSAPRSWRVAGVAAAVAAAVVLVPLIASLSSESSDDRDNETAALEETAGEADDHSTADSPLAPEEALEPGAGVTSTTATSRLAVPLGAFEDDDDLVAAAQSAPATAYGLSTPDAVAGTTGCLADLLAALPPDVDVLLTATASLDGAPVDVVVTRDEVRIAGGDCTDVLVRPR